MKNKFCSIFLLLFALDGILGILSGGLALLGSDFFYGTLFHLFVSVFTFCIIVCAIIQVIIGFIKRLRWSARIIGMYIIFYSLLTPVVNFLYGFYLGTTGMSLSEIAYFGPRSPFMNIYATVIGFVQIILFFWALKDLSKGHYLSTE